MKYRRLAAALTAALCCAGLFGCSSTKADTSSVVIHEDGAGDLVEPAEDDPEYSLGSYRCSAGGVKLYYDEETYPTSLMLYFEKLFGTYADRDYDTYRSCIWPAYVEAMDEYLPKEFDYDLTTSFEQRCDTLQVEMGGSYRLTRIKADVPEEDFSDEFFSQLSPICGDDFGEKVKEEADNLYCVQLYIMVMNETDTTDQLFFKNTEKGMGIVVAEKDGQYYAFC